MARLAAVCDQTQTTNSFFAFKITNVTFVAKPFQVQILAYYYTKLQRSFTERNCHVLNATIVKSFIKTEEATLHVMTLEERLTTKLFCFH